MYALVLMPLIALTMASAPSPPALVQLEGAEIASDSKADVRLIPTRDLKQILRVPVLLRIESDGAYTDPVMADDWLDEPLYMHRLNPAQLRMFEAWMPNLDYDKVRWRGGTGWVGDEDASVQGAEPTDPE